MPYPSERGDTYYIGSSKLMTIEPHNEPGGLGNNDHRHAQSVLSRLCLLGIPIHTVLIFAFEWLDQHEMAIFNIGSTLTLG